MTPMFTKRHYEAIAEALNKAHYYSQLMPTSGQEMGVALVQSYLQDMFLGDNPRFDEDKFDAACAK